MEIEVKLNEDSKSIEDPPGYINPLKLFQHHKDLCFVSTYAAESKYFFSNFALDIFR
jgi:hypothetical protein